MKKTLTIGELSKLTKCSIPTIRYYEKIGLTPEAKRTQSGHRFYTEDDAGSLAFVKRCRNFGFSLKQISLLVKLSESSGRPCGSAKKLLSDQLKQVRSEISEMQQLESTLENVISRGANCDDSSCSVLAGLKGL